MKKTVLWIQILVLIVEIFVVVLSGLKYMDKWIRTT